MILINISPVSFHLSPSHKDVNQSVSQSINPLIKALVSRVEGLSASPAAAVLVPYSNQHLSCQGSWGKFWTRSAPALSGCQLGPVAILVFSQRGSVWTDIS